MHDTRTPDETTPEGVSATHPAATPSPRTSGASKRRRSGQRLAEQERAQAQDTFLAAFAECGILKQAAHVAGVDRATVYAWRDHDSAFRARFELAEADANDVIRGEIRRRGVDGWDEPVYQGGELVGTIRRYSDGALFRLAASRMPEYRDKLDVTSDSKAIGQTHASILALINDPDAAALACDLLARLAGGRALGAATDPSGTGDSGE